MARVITWRFALLALLLAITLAGCSRATRPDTPTPMSSQSDLCNYARAAASAAIQEPPRILEELKAEGMSDKAHIKRSAEELRTLASEFERKPVPDDAGSLQAWTVGSIVAAANLLDAWVVDNDGQTEATIYLTLAESVAGEVKRIRLERNCW